jgi:Flp pilus assembly protein TadB
MAHLDRNGNSMTGVHAALKSAVEPNLYPKVWLISVVTIATALAASRFHSARRTHRYRASFIGSEIDSNSSRSGSRHTVRRASGNLSRLDLAVFAPLGQVALRFSRRQPSHNPERVGKLFVLILGALVVHPLISLMLAAVAVARRRRQARRATDERVRSIRTELSLLLDLLRVAVSSGLTIRQAIGVTCGTAAEHGADGELARLLGTAIESEANGVRLTDFIAALPDLPVIGPELRLLAATLLATERYGTPPGPGLAALAEDVRDARRRTAETDAQRVPIKMLAPLILLLLPSFVLLTIAPLLAGGLRSLGLSA